jgi:hypothetical protein
MIQVTLTFSSIAAAVQALSGLPEADVALTTVKDAAATTGKPSGATTAPPPRTAAADHSTPAQPAAAPATQTAATKSDAAAPSAPARADVSKAAVALALKDKPKIVEILAEFGAKGVKDVPDDKLAEVYPLIQAALGG